jgi:membrane-bound lytic murein transglycosylase B
MSETNGIVTMPLEREKGVRVQIGQDFGLSNRKTTQAMRDWLDKVDKEAQAKGFKEWSLEAVFEDGESFISRYLICIGYREETAEEYKKRIERYISMEKVEAERAEQLGKIYIKPDTDGLTYSEKRIAVYRKALEDLKTETINPEI